MLSLLVPVMLILLVFIFLLIGKAIFKYKARIKTITILSMVIIIYMYQPNIAHSTFALLICQELAPNQLFLEYDLDEPCYSPRHKKWLAFFVMPCIIFIIFGLPLFVTVYLCCKRKQIQNKEILLKFGFLVKGLKFQIFYFEIILIIRKTIIVLLQAFFFTGNK